MPPYAVHILPYTNLSTKLCLDLYKEHKLSRTHDTKPDNLRYGGYDKDYVQIPGTWTSIQTKTTKPKKRRTLDNEWRWYKRTPSAWNNMFHTRPRRAEAHLWERRVTMAIDVIDCDTPNNSNKPHQYYY